MVPFWFLGSKFLQLKYGFDILVGDAFMLLPEGLIVLLGPLVGIFLDRMKFSTRSLLLQLGTSIAILPIAYLVLIRGPSMENQATSTVSSRRLQMVGTDNSTWTPGGGDTYTPIVPIFNVPGDLHNSRDGDSDSPYANPFYAYLGMLLAGGAYAISNSLFWTLIQAVCSKRYLSQQSGVVASMMNVLPTALPPLIVAINLAYEGSESKDSVTSSERGLVVLAVSGAIGALCAVLAAMAWQESEGSGGAERSDADVEMQPTTYNRLSHDSTHSNHTEDE